MIFEARELTFSYPNTARRVLRDASLCLGEGDVISVLGRNGAGKSTLLYCLLGLLRPQSGETLLCGKSVSALTPRQVAAFAGFVPQTHSSAFAYTVLDYVLMGCASGVGLFSAPGKAERGRAMDALAQMGIAQLAGRPCTQLSGGERQQAAIARAIVNKPRAVLFDEPTAHLDFANQLRVLRMLRALSEEGYGVIVTTHNPDHALLLGGKAALVDGTGAIRFGPVGEIVTRERLAQVYGADVRLEYVESLGRTVCLYPSL